MHKHIFAEFAVGGVKNRNKIADVNQFRIPKDALDCYRSIFLFKEDLDFYVSRTKSVNGFAGTHIADSMTFDFDGSDLDAVRKEVIAFCQHTTHKYELPIEYMRISFSGNKGFHVEIPFQCFSLNPQPSKNFWRAYKAIADEMIDDFLFIDSKIYESKRLFRIVNTVNSKSNLYKIPLSFDEMLNLTQDEIRELAKSPREINYLPADEMLEISALSELYKKWIGFNFFTKDSQPKLSTSSLFDGVEEGQRNDRAIRLTGLIIDKGFDLSATLEVIKMWNEKNRPPLDDKEIEYLVTHAFEKYKKVDTNSKIEIFSLKDAEGVYKAYAQSIDGAKVTTGYPLIDNKIRGIVRGETCCILGKTGVGKSAVLQNIGLRYAKESSEPVLFFSLEMPITGVFERTIQIETGLGGRDVEEMYKEGNQANERAKLVFDTIPNFYTVTKSGLNLDSIRNIVKFAENEVYHKPTGLMAVDYLGLVRGKGTDIYQQISQVARGMKDLAKELNVPIIFLSQVNRGFNEFQELTLGAARDSGAIDEASDFVLGLWKDEENPYGKEKPDNILNFGILKNRKGGLGTVKIAMEKKSLKLNQIE